MYFTINTLVARAQALRATQTASFNGKTVAAYTNGTVTFSKPLTPGELNSSSWYQPQPKVKKTMQGWCDEAIRTSKTIRIQREGMTKGVFTLRPFKVRGENKINVEITREDENRKFYSSMLFSGDFVTI